MPDNDSHYNNGLTTPLPDFEEGGPVFSPEMGDTNNGNENGTGNGNNNGNTSTDSTPITPLPFPEEGGPVYTPENNGSGNQTNRPQTPTTPPAWNQNRPITPTTPNNPLYPSYPNISQQNFGQVRFLNASSNTFTVNIYIDNDAYAINSRFGTISNYDWIADGFHTVTIRRSTGMRSILLQQNFPFVASEKVTMVLTDSASGGLELVRIVDTGCTNLPYNSGCYRFANMTYSGSSFDVLLYGGETIFRNVAFQSATPYKQAVAGSYEMYVTNSAAYTFLRELPIIVIGTSGITNNTQEPLLSYTVDINAGRNYTSYLIGNSWSDLGMRVITVED